MRYRIGEVTWDSPEHAIYAGMISLPYLTRHGVVSMKFRRPHSCTPACEHQKYLTPYPTRLYNTLSMDKADELGYIGIAEGELDALVLDWGCDIPAVGVPGVETWTKHSEWRELFRGYRDVLIFADGDDPGMDLARQIIRDVPGARLVSLAGGKDVSDVFKAEGAAEIRRKAGLDV